MTDERRGGEPGVAEFLRAIHELLRDVRDGQLAMLAQLREEAAFRRGIVDRQERRAEEARERETGTARRLLAVTRLAVLVLLACLAVILWLLAGIR